MSIPSTDRSEYVVSSLGYENSPQDIIVKGSLWTLQTNFDRFILKDYNGYSITIESLLVKRYLLTQALKLDRTIDTDRFWVWIIDYSNNLALYEIEPFTAAPPVITYTKTGIASNVTNLSVYVKDSAVFRLLILFNSGDFRAYVYNNIRTDAPIISDLNWGINRLSSISSFSNNQLDVSYLDVASPPNVYLENYILAVPTNFNVSQVDDTNEILLNWNAVADADSYIIDRDTNPTFPLPVSITTSFLTYSDYVLATGTYYYRIRAINSPLLLLSPWSGNEQLTLSILVGFYGAPLSAFTGNIISFTDISIPTGTITSWDWDFGDESSHSTLQNPTHSYSTPGTYTVTLIAYSMSESDTIIKIDYINITPSLLAAFTGDPTIGDANLPVGFTDESLGYPISWDWNFGDGSSHSFVEDPNHVYTKAGLHTVSLTISDGIDESTTTIVDYISVSMVADFSSDIQIGPADLTVHFTDQSLGDPTFWDWDFGDGSLHSTLQNPVHVYTDANNYTVTLIAYNSEASDIEIKTNYITVSSTADFFAEPRTGYSTLSVQFIDLSKGNISSWYWDFGDSYFSTDQNPVHFYSSPGEYTVTLVASNSFNSDSETKVNYIIVSGIATPDIAPEPDILMYLSDKVNASRNNVGIKIKYKI